MTQLEESATATLYDSGRRLLSKPLAYESLAQPGLRGQPRGCDRSLAGHRSVEAQLVAHVDHARGDQPTERSKYDADLLFDDFWVDFHSWCGHEYSFRFELPQHVFQIADNRTIEAKCVTHERLLRCRGARPIVAIRGRPPPSDVIALAPKKENYAGGSTWMRVPWTVPLVDATT